MSSMAVLIRWQIITHLTLRKSFCSWMVRLDMDSAVSWFSAAGLFKWITVLLT